MLFERERPALRPVSQRPPAQREIVALRIAQRDGYVAVESNRYPVPFAWAGLAVQVSLRSEEIVLTQAQGELTLRYHRLMGKHQAAQWNGPARELPARGRQDHAEGPPQYDPAYMVLGDVEMRPLERYDRLTREMEL